MDEQDARTPQGGGFWDPGVVKNGFLAKFHAGLTYLHKFSMYFLKIVILELQKLAPGAHGAPWPQGLIFGLPARCVALGSPGGPKNLRLKKIH